jgi:hypothetical protein
MSQDELVNAYIEGSVSRRTFIRRLVVGGVSLGAAVSYAHLLAPDPAGARPGQDFYKDKDDNPDAGSQSIQLGQKSSGGPRRRRRRKKRP